MARQVTDRAQRYRAQRNMPPGKRICIYCGSPAAKDIDHIDGHEEHTEPENLAYSCRSCNVRKANAFRAAGLGRKTRQYNPGPFEQWLRTHSRSLHNQPTAAEIRTWRAEFARARNPKHEGARTWQQWVKAVLALRGHDTGIALEDAIAMVHATPPAKRSSYAREIWERRREHGGLEEVPF